MTIKIHFAAWIARPRQNSQGWKELPMSQDPHEEPARQR
jgi:hypothetical protein